MSRNNSSKKVETIATTDPVEVIYEFYDSDLGNVALIYRDRAVYLNQDLIVSIGQNEPVIFASKSIAWIDWLSEFLLSDSHHSDLEKLLGSEDLKRLYVATKNYLSSLKEKAKESIADPVEETIADPINDLLAVAPFVEIEGIPVTFSRGHFRVKGIPFAFYKDQEVILLETDNNVLASVQDLTFPKLGLSLRKWIESHSVSELIALGIVSQNDRERAIDAQKQILKAKADLRAFKQAIAPPKPEMSLADRLKKEQEMTDKKLAKRQNARTLLAGL